MSGPGGGGVSGLRRGWVTGLWVGGVRPHPCDGYCAVFTGPTGMHSSSVKMSPELHENGKNS